MSESNGKKTLRAYLGMPAYGGMSAFAALAFHRPSLRPVKIDGIEYPLDVTINTAGSSLLAHNMNHLWCWTLSHAHQGRQVDYFAMMHSDIEPPMGWLDHLVEEMHAFNLDVLGVVSPIKDQKGYTSIALHREDGYTWKPHCRLTMREIYQLPETFTEKDIGYPILLNTGLWVCRWNMEWARKIHFTINDRIVFDTTHDLYRPEVEPEDWYVSRLFHELNLKVGCTRKVRLDHRGEAVYSNGFPWGTEDYDTQHVEKSVLAGQIETDGFRFPYDVDGWLLPQEGRALYDLARDKGVLEIGSYCGKSTICLAQSARSVVAVDPHDGSGTPKPRDTWMEFNANLDHYGVAAIVIPWRGRMADLYPDGTVDLVFIDGAHDLDSVRQDIESARRFLKPDGLIAFHDYRSSPGQIDGRWDPGVTEAVDEFLAAGAELVSQHGTIAVVKPPVKVREECHA